MDKDLAVILGSKIRTLRKNNGYTQDKFSELLGIDPKHLSRIECGKTSPSLNLLKNISSVFNVEILVDFKIESKRSKTDLIKEVNHILKNSDEAKVRTFYKILTSIDC